MDISVVIPFYNEEANVDFVLDEIVAVLRPLGRSFEILAVDDGSSDGTAEALKKRQGDILELRVMCHSRNRGQGAAFWTGFQNALGAFLVTLDGDGQNDVHDVPRMLELIDGYDAVIGQRVKRRDPPSKRWASSIAYHARQLVLKDGIRDTACSLKVMRRKTVGSLLPIRGFFRFIPFLLKQGGYSYTTVEVNHRPRQKGKAKYSLLNFFFLATIADLLFMWWYKKECFLRSSNEKDVP
jgi:dolichol-phosphate mannosyltransferase